MQTIPLPDQQLCAVALRKMFSGTHYSCCDVSACFKLLKKPMPREIARYDILHCVHWNEMPKHFPEQILRDIVTHLFTDSTVVNLLNTMAGEDPELSAARSVLMPKEDPYWNKASHMEDLLKRIDEKIDELVRLELHFQAKRKSWLFRLLGI